MIACAAMGLWIHQKYVVASAEWTARDHAFTELAATAGYSRTALSSETDRSGEADHSHKIDDVLDDILRVRRNRNDVMILTDKQSRIIQFSEVDELIRKALPQQIQFYDEWVTDSEFQHGEFATSIGPLLAVRWPTQNGYALIARPQAVITADGESIRETLPAAAGIALLWIGALQAVILYLFFAKLNTETETTIRESNTRTMQQAEELVRTQDVIIFGLAKLADSRDPETGMHLERISMYATQLATAMSRRPEYRAKVTPSFVRLIGISSALHDIGKVGVEDAILRKPGKLTDAERLRMQEHTLVGYECLKQIEQRLGPSNFLQMAREIGLNHHERWDGDGYPNGIAGETIPLAARIVAIADVYDALASKRVYKGAFAHEECVRMIREGAGTQFDPQIVEVFVSIQAEFESIHNRFGEPTQKTNPPAVSNEAMQCLENPQVAESEQTRASAMPAQKEIS